LFLLRRVFGVPWSRVLGVSVLVSPARDSGVLHLGRLALWVAGFGGDGASIGALLLVGL